MSDVEVQQALVGGAVILVWLVLAYLSSALAHARGRSSIGWGLFGLLFGPLGLVVGLFPVNQSVLDARERGEELPDPVAKVLFWIMVGAVITGFAAPIVLVMSG